MIPLMAQVVVAPVNASPIRLWLPIFLVWLLLVVLGLILSPLIILACLIVGLNPFATVWRLMRVFAALAGTHIEVQAPDAVILVRVI
ncbi:MAG TPA: hypothetical protein VKT30_17075 [Caulobacteraceae bacterium]|nr:hypothetical protein [Caulobacteraceae bacterium]